MYINQIYTIIGKSRRLHLEHPLEKENNEEKQFVHCFILQWMQLCEPKT
jgi:hypothetical protein